MIIRYAFSGARYFPVMDDNNMYGVFSYSSPFEVLDYGKMYTTRPMAALFDAFVFSRLWKNMFILLLIMIILHFICCILLWKIFDLNNFKIGYISVMVFGLLPIGSEATYWISASSRIVVGLFFALLSMYFLMLYIGNSRDAGQGFKYIVFFFLANLISLGFYEQIIVVSFCGCIILLSLNFKQVRNKLVFFIPVINLAIILAYYKYFSGTGNMAARGQLVQEKYFEHIRKVFWKIREQLQFNQVHMYKQGLFRGIDLILENRAFIFLIIAAAVSVLMAYLCTKEKYETNVKVNVIKLITGILLIYIPFAPFFLLDSVLIAYRNAFLSVIGIGLAAEAVANLISRGRLLVLLRGIVTGVLVLFFILINAAVINDYRIVHETDRRIISEFLSNLNKLENGFSKDSIILIFDTRNKYIDFIGQKIGNCNSNDWGFMGALQAKTGEVPVRYVIPVAENARIELSEDKLRDAICMGMDNTNISMLPLKGNWESGSRLKLELPNGSILGYVEILSKDNIIFVK
jgi:type IV secretory pathway VirB3-like protein